MLRHVVLMRWAPTVAPAQAAEVLATLQDLVRSMPGALAANAAAGLGLADDAYDAALVADFIDEGAWRGYQADPRHLEFVSQILRPMLTGRAGTQIELPDRDVAEPR